MTVLTELSNRVDCSSGMTKIDLIAEVYERRGDQGAWAVEAINQRGDGEIYLSVFYGPEARSRALEYAREKYGEVQA